MKRVLCLGATSLAVLTALGFGISALERTVSAQAAATRGRAAAPAQGRAAAPATPAPAGRSAGTAAAGVPNYRVSPLWPKPLPNHWVFGSISGVAVDSRDHVWVVHRGADTLEANEKGMMANPPTSSVCCVAAPSVLEFDQAGTVLSSWGGPGLGFPWPQYTGGIAVDSKGDVWIAAYGLEPAAAGGGRGARGAAPAAAADGAAPAQVRLLRRVAQLRLQVARLPRADVAVEVLEARRRRRPMVRLQPRLRRQLPLRRRLHRMPRQDVAAARQQPRLHRSLRTRT
jgi:hypothetical protein